MIGARRSPGMRRCSGRTSSPRSPASACRRRFAAAAGRSKRLRESGITNFYWQYFQTPGVAEAEFERDVALTMRMVLGRGVSDPAASLFIEEGKGFLGNIGPIGRCRIGSAKPTSPISPRPTGNPASAAG